MDLYIFEGGSFGPIIWLALNMQFDESAFTDLGNQFLISYACSSWAGPFANLFNVGHAVELYLKAVVRRISPATDVSTYRHDVGRLLSDVQDRAAPLLSTYRLRQSAADAWLLNPIQPNGFGIDANFDHYSAHNELYWISRYLMDTKYLFASQKGDLAKNSFICVVMGLNEYWQPFFKELRQFLIAGARPRAPDRLELAVTNQALPLVAREYLRRIID